MTLCLLLLGCTRSHPAVPIAPDLSQTPADLGPSRAPLQLALVAIEEVSRLHRLLDGKVLAESGGALHALDREGGVRSLDSVFAALPEGVGELGSVGGSWPGTLLVETYRIGTGDGVTTGFALGGSERRATIERRLAGAYLLPPALWKGGALLTVRAEGHSSEFGAPLDRTARFELLGKGAGAAPRFPKDALFEDAFVAYPSGLVLALGGRRTRPVVEDDASEYEQEHHYMLDGAIIWQGDSDTLRPVQLPETSPRDRLHDGRLAAGRSEHDTLVYGSLEIWRQRRSTTQPYLARLGTAGWRRVPIATPILRIDRGSDDTTWAICGSDGYGSTDERFLARLILLADGGVRVERTPLAPAPQWHRLGEPAAAALRGCTELRPRELAVLGEQDLWLTAQCLPSKDSAPTLLLHTQLQKPLVTFKTLERSPASGR